MFPNETQQKLLTNYAAKATNEEFIIIKDPDITEGTLLATTPMAWIPEGAKVEIINENDEPLLESSETKNSDKNTSSF